MRVLLLLFALVALARAAPEPVDYCSAPQTPWQVYTCEQLATRIAPPCVPQRRAPALSAPTVSVDDAEFWTKVFANDDGASTNAKTAVDASATTASASAPVPVKASLVL